MGNSKKNKENKGLGVFSVCAGLLILLFIYGTALTIVTTLMPEFLPGWVILYSAVMLVIFDVLLASALFLSGSMNENVSIKQIVMQR